jgi:lysophospholipase
MNMKEKTNLMDKHKVFLGEEDYSDKISGIVSPLLTANRKTDYFKSVDDTRICYEYYNNPQEKAIIVIAHGFCEFKAKFEEVIFYFFQEGYSVFVLDQRGHGYSNRIVEDISKVHVHSYDEYVLDLRHFITEIVMKNSMQKKLVLYAHSMGGAIGALFLEQYPEVFTCAILSSPMLEMNCGTTPVPIVWLVMMYKKLFQMEEEYVSGHGAFDGMPHFETSSCLSEVRYNHIFSKRQQDDHYQTYGGSCAWTLASMIAVNKLQKNAKRVKTPILLFQAGRDTTVKPKGQDRFAKKSPNTQLVKIPSSKHEIYNADTAIRKEYYQKIFAFLEDNINS